MALSDRIRPNSEAAPWVVEEVKSLEAKLAKAIEALEHYESAHYDSEGRPCMNDQTAYEALKQIKGEKHE